MACVAWQVMWAAWSKLVGGICAWTAVATSSSAPAVTRDLEIISELSVYLSLDRVADDVARRAADQAGPDHRAEAAARHQADAAAQRCTGDCTLLAG